MRTSPLSLKQPRLRFGRSPIGRSTSSSQLHGAVANALDDLESALGRGFTGELGDDGKLPEHHLVTLLTVTIYKHREEEVEDKDRATEYVEGVAPETLFDFLKGGSDHAAMRFGDIIDGAGLTADLYQVRELVRANASALDYNVREILARPNVLDYLFLRASTLKRFTKPEAIYNYLAQADGGSDWIHQYLVERAFWDVKDARSLRLPHSRSDDQIIKELKRTRGSLAKEAFEARLEKVLGEYIFDAEWRSTITKLKLPGLVKEDYPALIAAFKKISSTPSAVSKAYLISVAYGVLEARAKGVWSSEDSQGTDPYAVDYYDDDSSALEIDTTSIKAAAQLFFAMVWGDELGVFRVMNEIAAPSTKRRPLSVRDEAVSEDLRLYVLDEQFVDDRVGRVRRRVAPAEREMFYRQVFGVGSSPITAGMTVNDEFWRYWGVLVNEVTTYIGKVEDSSNPDGLVSKERIHQAVVDLQLNLSSHCVGMAKAAAPVIYAEMDFVIRRLLGTDEFTSQLSRRGRKSFMSVVEEVLGATDLNPLRIKGICGHQLLLSIANWTRGTLEDEGAFGDFVSTVEAFIVAESQLARERQRASDEDAASPGAEAMAPGLGAQAPKNGAMPSNWNF